MAEGRELVGRVAVVTGASRGIGRRVAVRLAERGAQVAVAARTTTKQPDNLGGLDETVRLVADAGGKAFPFDVDLSRIGAAEHLVDRVRRQLGEVDILVNVVARVDDPMYLPFEGMTVEEFRSQFELNLFAQYALMRGFRAGMVERGGGRVINFTSRSAQPRDAGTAPMPGRGGTGVAYDASKAAVNRMTNALANELRPQNIAVIALDPGSTTTENRLQVADRFGFSPEGTHDADLPARAAAYLAYCSDPMAYTGRVIVSRELVEAQGLLPGV